jgi:hypothetical protein
VRGGGAVVPKSCKQAPRQFLVNETEFHLLHYAQQVVDRVGWSCRRALSLGQREVAGQTRSC